MTDTFDLRADLAEIPFQGEGEEGNAYFTLKVKLLSEVRELRATLGLATDFDKIAELQEKLEAKEAELKANTYTVEMMAIPRRRREDIFEEALDKFPAKPSFIPNHVDEKTEFLRQSFVRVQMVAAATKRLISPKGAVQEESILETIQHLHDAAPDFVFDILEKKTQELNVRGDAQEDLHKGADF